jgi:hypothetical protein
MSFAWLTPKWFVNNLGEMQKSKSLPKTRCVLSGGRIAWVQQDAAPVTGSSSHLISQDRQVLCKGFDQIVAKVCRSTLGAVTALSSIKATFMKLEDMFHQ